MKKSIFIIVLVLTGLGYSQTNDSMVTVSGKVWYSESYCMGTPPQKDNLYEPHGYSGAKFYVVKKIEGKLVGEIILSFTSDQNGEFSFTIPKGEYYFYNNYPLFYQQEVIVKSVNSQDFEWLEGPEYKFNNESTYTVEFNYMKGCPPGPERM